MIKILMVNDVCDMGVSYAQAFNGFICEFKWTYVGRDFDLDAQIKWADVICYCGGDDISTSLYREKRKEAHYPCKQRDLYEIGVYNLARKLNKIQVGICRGFQFLAVMNGYKLVQHVNGHGEGDHDILFDGIVEKVNSYHHQAVVINDNTSEFYSFNENEFGVQWHPELGDNSRKVFQKLLSHHLTILRD